MEALLVLVLLAVIGGVVAIFLEQKADKAAEKKERQRRIEKRFRNQACADVSIQSDTNGIAH